MEYNAILNHHAFWFLETKKTAKLILEGFSQKEIVEKSLEDNIYQVESEIRRKEVANNTYKRLKDFNKEGLELFLNSGNEAAKLFIIISLMRFNRLFFEFMYEVYREHLILHEKTLKDSEMNNFFNEKKNQSQKFANLNENTIKRLQSRFIEFLKASGLIKIENNERIIIAPFVDFKLQDYLIDNDLKPYLISLTGEE